MKKLIQTTSLMMIAAGLTFAPMASAHGKPDNRPKSERMHKKADKPKKLKKPAPKPKRAPQPKHHHR